MIPSACIDGVSLTKSTEDSNNMEQRGALFYSVVSIITFVIWVILHALSGDNYIGIALEQLVILFQFFFIFICVYFVMNILYERVILKK